MKQFTLAIAIMFVIHCTVFASTDYIEGKIQGASYVFNKTVQPTSAADPRVELERDFVLQTTSGKTFFMPNVPRSMKVKGVNQTVRVYGEEKGNGTLLVHQILVKNGNTFNILCDWDEKLRERAAN